MTKQRFAIVPVSPSDGMLEAAFEALSPETLTNAHDANSDVYEAMISAAPDVPDELVERAVGAATRAIVGVSRPCTFDDLGRAAVFAVLAVIVSETEIQGGDNG